jgi:hypothetical protein
MNSMCLKVTVGSVEFIWKVKFLLEVPKCWNYGNLHHCYGKCNFRTDLSGFKSADDFNGFCSIHIGRFVKSIKGSGLFQCNIPVFFHLVRKRCINGLEVLTSYT